MTIIDYLGCALPLSMLGYSLGKFFDWDEEPKYRFTAAAFIFLAVMTLWAVTTDA